MLSDEIGFVEEVFRVGSIVVDEVDEQLSVRIVDRTVKQPFMEVVEVNLTTGFKALDEEAFDLVFVDCRVLFIENPEEV